jgi:DNA-binding transcriptional LysR family regulator
VTKHVAALEARVGARLFDRTTRRVSLTEAGRVYLERCLECLQVFEEADARVNELSHEPRGLLRVTAPIDLQGPIAGAIGRFMRASPQVTIDLRLSNRPVDLVEEGIDVALRVAAGLDGPHVARPLARVGIRMFASLEYLRQRGRPRRPEDLSSHSNLVFSEPRLRDEWAFARGARQIRVKLPPAMTSNSGAALREAMLAGAGIAVVPGFLVAADQEAGRAERILPEWTILPELRLFAVYPHRRFLAPKVRAFVDFLRATYGDGSRDPWWPEAAAPPPLRRGRSASISRRR